MLTPRNHGRGRKLDLSSENAAARGCRDVSLRNLRPCGPPGRTAPVFHQGVIGALGAALWLSVVLASSWMLCYVSFASFSVLLGRPAGENLKPLSRFVCASDALRACFAFWPVERIPELEVPNVAKKSSTKRPAQVAASTKAAQLKAENTVKRPQPLWLQQRPKPVLESDELPPAPERVNKAHQSQGPPRLLCKHEVCAIAGATFPSVWAWMRAGTFPRSRVVGGKSMWLSSEIEAWITSLPLRPLKGDSRGPQP